MSIAENIPAAQARQKTLTYEDYVSLTPPDSGNYELHNGKIIYMASPTPEHQDVVTELSARMRIFASGKKLGKVFSAPLDVVFNPIDTFQPDILFIAKENLSIIRDKKVEGAPDLVVEILSESNMPKEMSYKKYIYESSGVREYWVINLAKSSITLYLNLDGDFVQKGIFKGKDMVASEVLKGFRVRVAEILTF